MYVFPLFVSVAKKADMEYKQNSLALLWNKISQSFGYKKLEEESSSRSDAGFVQMSERPKSKEEIADSNTTLEIDEEGLIVVSKSSKELSWYQKNIGVIYMVLATLSGTILNLTIKAISKSDERLPVLELVIIRGVLGSIITAGMMYHQNINYIGPSDAFTLLVMRGVLAFMALTFNFFALFSLSLGDATILSFCAPMMTGFLGAIILKEKWEKVDQLAGFFSLIGLLFITRPPFLFGALSKKDNGIDDSIMVPDGRSIPAIIVDSETSDMLNETIFNNTVPSNYSTNQTLSNVITIESLETDLLRLFGIIMGLSAAFCAASSFIVIRKLKERVNPLHVIFYFHWVLVPFAIVLGPFIPSWMDSAKWIIPQHISTWALVFVGTTFGTLGQIFMTKALQTETAAKAASINNIQVIFAFTFEFLLWGAIPTALSVFGASIIIASLVCATIYKNKFH